MALTGFLKLWCASNTWRGIICLECCNPRQLRCEMQQLIKIDFIIALHGSIVKQSIAVARIFLCVEWRKMTKKG